MHGRMKMEIKVLYYDYIGFEHTGYVILTQPCNDSMEGDDVHYCFVRDENNEFNDKIYRDNNGNMFYYAEIRKSTELIRI